MEIEKKYTVKGVPEPLSVYEKKEIEQGYLCGDPVIRIRKSNEDYLLTYKSKKGVVEKPGRTARVNEEMEFWLSKEGYLHLKEKTDDYMVCKTRYLIPLEEGLTAELDVFHGRLSGLVFVEVEFDSEEAAEGFKPPAWFDQDVSLDQRYSNKNLAKLEQWVDFGILG